MTDFKNVFVVLHNVHSVSKIVDTAQVVYGLGFPNFIVSKPEGTAAQSGVPDANKLAYRLKANFMVLPDLPDVIDLLDISRPILLTSPMLTKSRVALDELSDRISTGERVLIALSGSNSSFSRKEMDLGECVAINSRIDIGPSGTISIILYHLKTK